MLPATPLTGCYAALLALLFVALAVRVIARRRASRISLGVAGDAALERAARVHANFAEYTPLALLLMLLVELSGYPAWIIHAAGLALLLGRLVHAWGVSQASEDFRLRVTGVALTLTVTGVLALLLLARWPLAPASP